jgi:hypothetical protein
MEYPGFSVLKTLVAYICVGVFTCPECYFNGLFIDEADNAGIEFAVVVDGSE